MTDYEAVPFLSHCGVTTPPTTVEQFDTLFDVHFLGGIEARSSNQTRVRGDIDFSTSQSRILAAVGWDADKLKMLFPSATPDVRAQMVRDASAGSVIFVCTLERELALPANRAAEEPPGTTSALVVMADLQRNNTYGRTFLVPNFPFHASVQCRGIAGLLADERRRRMDQEHAAPTSVMCAVTGYDVNDVDDETHARIALFVEARYDADARPHIRRIVVRTELSALFKTAFVL